MLEIEAKAWIYTKEEKKRILDFLETKAQQRGDVLKNDSMYWKNNNPRDYFRVREENGTYTITQKKRNISENGVEANEETEFCVERIDDFLQIMKSAGYEKWYEKQKRGVAYQYTSLLCEVVCIDGLGEFLEIEKLIDFGEDAEKSQKEVLSVFSDVELLANIEPKSYRSLLGK